MFLSGPHQQKSSLSLRDSTVADCLNKANFSKFFSFYILNKMRKFKDIFSSHESFLAKVKPLLNP